MAPVLRKIDDERPRPWRRRHPLCHMIDPCLLTAEDDEQDVEPGRQVDGRLKAGRRSGCRHDDGVQAASVGICTDGAGTLDTSWDSAAWDARCSTFFRDRWASVAALTDHHPHSAPTRRVARSGLEGQATMSGSRPPELAARWRIRRPGIALRGTSRLLLALLHR